MQTKTTKEIQQESVIQKDATIQCGECNYTTTTRQGLKIHKTRIHSKINVEQFPASCFYLWKSFRKLEKLKKHKKSEHTYHVVRY